MVVRAGTEAREPVAILFGEPIFLDQFQPSNPSRGRDGKTEDEYRLWLSDWQIKQAKGKMWSDLFNKFCENHDCEPSEEEVESFNVFSDKSKRKREMEQERRFKDVVKQLQDPSITEKKKMDLETKKGRLERSRKIRQRVEETQSKIDKDELQKMKTRISNQWVKRWKTNKAFYEVYGGRVIFQQAGIEPLGAWEAWFKENEEKKALRLLDPKLEKAFWSYFHIRHTDVGEGLKKDFGLKHPFEKPYWLLEKR